MIELEQRWLTLSIPLNEDPPGSVGDRIILEIR